MLSPQSAATVRSPNLHTPASVEFQRLWQAGPPPQIETFLSERSEIPLSELATMVRIDLRQRWRRNKHPGAGDYLVRFPQLLAEGTLVVDLIYTEFLVREELGEHSHLSSLQLQFPQFANELAAQVELHLALADSPGPSKKDGDTELPQDTLGFQPKQPTRLPSLGPAYEVTAEIGRGGMGVVFRARQVGLNRMVALKMVRGAEYASAELLSRFRAEAEAVARLHHPQIVQIYDYGEHDGLPYLALELIEGGTLASRIDGTPWPARQAATLIETLAKAVGFAHLRGVIHRDLKPANVLLQSSDVSPKIADFGLAKVFREQSSEQTQSGALLGTPSYMAPEQAAGQSRQIGPAADIYALGAILYELLTGRPPFRAETPIATLQQVLTSEPVSIKLLAPRVPRDLATICYKCLRREPERRYTSAAELADDLSRFLADQPIHARPVSRTERAWRWCRRNPVPTILGSAVALLLTIVAAVSSHSSARIRTQLEKTAQSENAERTARLDAQTHLWDTYIAEVTARTTSRQIGQRSQSLRAVDNAVALLPEIGRTPQRVQQLRNAAIAALALPDFCRTLPNYASLPNQSQTSLCTAADRSAVKTSEGELFVVRPSDGTKLCVLETSGAVGFPLISHDGRFVVLLQNGAKVWRIDGLEPTVVWQDPDVAYFNFAPDGPYAAVSGATGVMRRLDLESGSEICQLGHGAARSWFEFHMPTKRIAVLAGEGLQIISWETGELLKELPLPDSTHPRNKVDLVRWHPSGDYLLLGPSFEGGAALMHLDSAKVVMIYPHRNKEMGARFFNDGEFLFTYSYLDGSLQLWHTGTGRELLRDSTYTDFGIDQSPTHIKLHRLSNSELHIWDVVTTSECSQLPQGLHPALGEVHSLDVSPDGRLLAISRTNGLEVWDLQTERRWLESAIVSSQVKFTKNGDLIVSSRHSITRWPRKILPRSLEQPTSKMSESELEISYGPPHQLAGPTNLGFFAIDPSGDKLLMMPARNGARVIDVHHPDDVVRLATKVVTNRMAISSDGAWAVLANRSVPGATAFHAFTGDPVTELAIKRDGLPIFSPDNRWLATSSAGVWVWRVSDWQLATEFQVTGRTIGGQDIAFSPDSRVLAIGQPSGSIRLADPATGEEWFSLTDPDRSPGAFLAFTPDQSKLIALAADDHAAPRIWNLAAIRRELDMRGLDWPIDVLPTKSNANSIDDSIGDSTRLAVTFDSGNFLKKAEARDLVSRARSSSPEQARELYAQAVQADPECGLAHSELAWILATGPVELRNADLSLEHARRAVALEPGHQAYLNTLGIALCRNAHYDEAIRVLERSLALSADEGAAFDLLFLALGHAGKGDVTTAQDYYNQAKAWSESHPSNTAGFHDFLRLYEESRAAVNP